MVSKNLAHRKSFSFAVSKTCCQIRICQHSLLIFPWMKFCPLYNIRPAEIHALIRSREQMDQIQGFSWFFSSHSFPQLRVIWNWYQKCWTLPLSENEHVGVVEETISCDWLFYFCTSNVRYLQGLHIFT